MFAAIGRFFASLARLADGIDALTATTAEVNARLRSQLQLDQADAPRVIEHHDPEADAPGKPGRNGKREKATA